MIERIKTNEERLDKIQTNIKELEKSLEKFKENQKNIKLVNEYYGSKKWFKDKELFEKGKIPNIKAGVLSEDSIWNMNEDINDIIETMNLIIKTYSKNKTIGE